MAFQVWFHWFQRTFAFSNSRQAWQERLATLALIASAIALLWFGTALPALAQVILWGVQLVLAALCLRRGWITLFGPVFFYDLVRSVRRTRFLLLRWGYALLLAVLLFWVYFMWTARRHAGLSTSELAAFAASFFYMFMVVQFVTVALLTPAYVAGAIAEEKDRKTLEFLLATDLRNREIVLGKLVARVFNLTLIILVGLPILSFLQFLGGVSPALVLAGFAATVSTMVSLAGLGIFNSVLARKPRDAITLTYLGGLIYLILSLGGWLFFTVSPVGTSMAGWGLRQPLGWDIELTLGDLAEWFAAGNIVVAVLQLGGALGAGRVPEDLLPRMVFGYSLFHGLLAVSTISWAVLRLRTVALKESYGKVQRLPMTARLFGRPRIGEFPMVWKEVYSEPRLRLNWFARLVLLVFLVASFLPPVFIYDHYLRSLQRSPVTNVGMPANYAFLMTPEYQLASAMNGWTRAVGSIVACLMLLAVAVRAASSISGERDRQTMDGLLTTPLSAEAILFGKWLGSIVSVRWAWLWLGMVWALGMVTEGLHPLAVPLLLSAWMVYAAVSAGIGLWCSMICRTTLRATIATIMLMLAVGVGHWVLMGLCCYMPLGVAGVGRNIEFFLKMEFSQTPPAVLGWLALYRYDFEATFLTNHSTEMTIFALFGVASWGLAALVMWFRLCHRFRVLTNREPTRRRIRQRVPSSARRA